MKEAVTIIGTLNMELFLSGAEDLPEWGKQVHAKGYRVEPAGSGPRVAYPLARIGVESIIIGKVGSDAYGGEILQAVRDHSGSTAGIEITESGNTGMCVILTKRGGERAYIGILGSVVETDEQLIMDHYNLIEKTRLLLITGYFNLPGIGYTSWRRILERARSDGKYILLDTGWDTGNWNEETKREVLSLLPMVNIFLPNREEARALSGMSSPEEMARFFHEAGAEEVIIKLDKDGCAGYSRNEGYREKGALPVEAIDTTAAGEAFNAGIIWGLIMGWNMEQRMLRGNALAGLFISDSGREYPSLKKIEQYMEAIKDAEES